MCPITTSSVKDIFWFIFASNSLSNQEIFNVYSHLITWLGQFWEWNISQTAAILTCVDTVNTKAICQHRFALNLPHVAIGSRVTNLWYTHLHYTRSWNTDYIAACPRHRSKFVDLPNARHDCILLCLAHCLWHSGVGVPSFAPKGVTKREYVHQGMPVCLLWEPKANK